MSIEINHNTKVDSNKVKDILENQGTLYLKINRQLIKDDIARLKKMLTGNVTAITSNNIKNTIKYLENLKTIAKTLPLSLSWTVENNKIKSRPFEVLKIEQLGINTTDYISLDGKVLVNIDYSDLINAIALELAHSDFCISYEDVENRLSDISIISINSIDILKTKELLDDDMAMALMSARIEDTKFMSSDTGNRYDYFGNNLGCGKTYREMIESSINNVMQYIVGILWTIFNQLELKVYLCGVYNNALSLIVDIEHKDEIKEVIESNEVMVRIFGRRFEVIPKVEMY